MDDLIEEKHVPMPYDPSRESLDLTREEKRRTTALMLAIQAQRQHIIQDADYLRESIKLDEDRRRRGETPQLKSATMDAIVVAAAKFEHFIATGNPQPLRIAMEDEDDGTLDAEVVKESE